MRITLLVASFVACSTALGQQVPVAVDDFYESVADSALTVDAPGVLANDSSDYAIEAILLTPPVDGSVTLSPDGSFVYTPDPGLTGTDSFTYAAATDETPEQFTVDGSISGVRMSADLTTVFGLRSDSDSSGVTGTITASVVPNTEPFGQIQVLALDLVLANALNLSFDYGSIAGVLNVTTDPNDLNLLLVTVGAETSVDAGSFSQSSNEFNLGGTINVSASGLIGTQVTSGPADLDATVPADLNGTIIQNGSDLEIEFPLQASGVFQVEGNDVNVTLTGFVAATGPVASFVLSESALVTITVAPVGTDTEPTDLAHRFALFQAFPNPVGRQTTITYDLPSADDVSLALYDALGRRVMTLEQGLRAPGRHRVSLDASGLPPGIYVYRLQAGTRVDMKTMIVLR